jgi:hypothetical protein
MGLAFATIKLKSYRLNTRFCAWQHVQPPKKGSPRKPIRDVWEPARVEGRGLELGLRPWLA